MFRCYPTALNAGSCLIHMDSQVPGMTSVELSSMRAVIAPLFVSRFLIWPSVNHLSDYTQPLLGEWRRACWSLTHSDPLHHSTAEQRSSLWIGSLSCTAAPGWSSEKSDICWPKGEDPRVNQQACSAFGIQVRPSGLITAEYPAPLNYCAKM
ncbi:hypothetical protein XENOCAPTIV_026259 [Xenoophorus captivus]|uniref:Uncharacterized protein n=1 Tax=Xenoophorus captivus TaxID=1517983 RepID=A0ABV0Q700_9TELE